MFRKLFFVASCVLALSVTALAEDDDDERASGDRRVTTPTPVPVPATTASRLLASNCFQCHGTNGSGGFERITGGEAGEIREFRSKIAGKDIMAAHAQGYTDAQIEALVSYLNQLR